MIVQNIYLEMLLWQSPCKNAYQRDWYAVAAYANDCSFLFGIVCECAAADLQYRKINTRKRRHIITQLLLALTMTCAHVSAAAGWRTVFRLPQMNFSNIISNSMLSRFTFLFNSFFRIHFIIIIERRAPQRIKDNEMPSRARTSRPTIDMSHSILLIFTIYFRFVRQSTFF